MHKPSIDQRWRVQYSKCRSSLVMDQRVITEWCQPLRSSENAIVSFCVAASRKRSKHSLITVQKTCLRIRQPTEIEFESVDHMLCLWLTVEKCRKIHLDTRGRRSKARGRKIAHGVEPDGQL